MGKLAENVENMQKFHTKYQKCVTTSGKQSTLIWDIASEKGDKLSYVFRVHIPLPTPILNRHHITLNISNQIIRPRNTHIHTLTLVHLVITRISLI